MSGRRRRRRSGDGGCGVGNGGGVDDPAGRSRRPGLPGRWPGWTTVGAEPPGWSKCPGRCRRNGARARASRWRPACRRRPWPRRPPCARERGGGRGVRRGGPLLGARCPARRRRVRRAVRVAEGLAEVCGIEPTAPAPSVPAHGRSTSGSGLDVRRGERSSNCCDLGGVGGVLVRGAPPHGQRHLRDPVPPPSRCTSCSCAPERLRRGGTIGRVLGHGVLEHRAQLVGHAVAAQVGDGLAGDPQELGDDLLALAPLEGRPTRDDREQGGGEAVDVRLPGGRAPVEHLGRSCRTAIR